MTFDINRIVDDIMGESQATTPVSPARLPGDTVLFTVSGDLSTFSNAMDTIRSWPADKRAVIFCENIETLLPGKVLQEVAPQCEVVKSAGCIPEELLGRVSRVVIPAISPQVAKRFTGTNEPGAIPAIWRAAAEAGVPVCGDVSCLAEIPAAQLDSGKAAELARALVEKGLVDLSTEGGGSPELQLMEQLVEHLCEQCEMEAGSDCTSCGMCKVRGF